MLSDPVNSLNESNKILPKLIQNFLKLKCLIKIRLNELFFSFFIANSNKKPESILKSEPAVNNGALSHCQHGKPILRVNQGLNPHPPAVLSSDKYMQPIERIPRCSTVSTAPVQQQQLETRLAESSSSRLKTTTSTSTTVVKVLPEDKIRIEIQSTKPSVSN